MRVIHLTESLGSGVLTAIAQYVRHGEGAEHVVLGRIRRGSASAEDIRNIEAEVEATTDIDGLMRRWMQLRRDRGAVFHAHSSLAGVLARTWRPLGRLVYSPHGLAFLDPSTRGFRRLSWPGERLLAPRANGYGAVSMQERSALASLGIPLSKIIVVPHSVELSGATRRRPPEGKPLRVTGVGRLSPQKDGVLFARIAQAVASAGLARFIWVGDGPPEQRAPLAAAGVEITGWLSQKEVKAYMDDSHVLLHTATYEGLPLAVVEAMASGLPVVARNIAAVQELSSPLKFDDIAQAVEQLSSLVGADNFSACSAAGKLEAGRRFTANRQARALAELWGGDAK